MNPWKLGLLALEEYKKLKYALLIPISVGIILLIIAAQIIGISFILEKILTSNTLAIICFVLVSILLAIVLTYRWKIIVRTHNYNIPFLSLFIYRLIGFAVSYLMPTMHVGGEPLRGYLLKKNNVPLPKAFSSVFIDKTLEFTVSITLFFLGAILFVFLVKLNYVIRIILIIISLILFLFFIYLIRSFVKEKKIISTILKKTGLIRIKLIKKYEQGLYEMEVCIENFYKNEKSCFRKSVLLTIISWVLMFLEYKFALLIIGVDANIFQIFFVVTGVGIAYSVPIPAAIGILELGQISVAKVLRLSHKLGLALSFLIRARDLLWTIVGLLLLQAEDLNIINITKESKKKEKEWERGLIEQLERKSRKEDNWW